MLTYGRNAKMTFCVFMSQERLKPFLGMLIFIMGVSPSNFVVVSFLLTSLRKSYFLRQRIRRYRFLKAGTAVLLVLNILLPASTAVKAYWKNRDGPMGRDGLGPGLDPVYWSHALNQGSAKGEWQVKMHLVSISTESSHISVCFQGILVLFYHASSLANMHYWTLTIRMNIVVLFIYINIL